LDNEVLVRWSPEGMAGKCRYTARLIQQIRRVITRAGSSARGQKPLMAL
jgi:hypothetical protein